ncbi:hypothetical protein L6164_021998 [Bauhinia variegata]|uniref:Uncharacterized protein n=1 Tax=Bauhinia variegata TaxID=167791 RepID=A0ACB9MDQ8_BAUVA|nr:hypothetical protein L6164_021998 [Bauhinia variegata]
MSSLRPESHVAQQIRRDKLRIQQLQDFSNNLEQSSLHPGITSDLVQVRNVRNANMLYEPAFYSSEMANFSSTLNPLSANRDAMACQELGAAEASRLMMPQFSESFPHSSDLASSSVHASSKEECAPRHFGNWRNTGLSQGYDWMVNYATSSVSNETIPNSLVVAELNNVSAYQQYAKPSYNELNDVQCSLSNISVANRESQRQLGGTHSPCSPPPPPPLYHNSLQDIVKSASISAEGSEMASVMQQTGHGIWVGNGNELVLLPSYGNQSNQFRFGNANSLWTIRTSDDSLTWHSPLGFTAKRSEQDSGPVLSDSNPQGLSLSLSSNAQSKLSVSQFGEGSGSDDLQSRCGISKDSQYFKSEKSMFKPPIISKDSGKSIQDIVGIPSNHGYRNVGPLGPFTGYATILKSSRFIRPAQQLLDEFCCFSGPNIIKVSDVSEGISGEVSASTSAEAFIAPESGIGANISTSGASSSKFYSSNEGGDGGTGSSFCMSSWPDYHQKKAKLLYMQEEVTRRYKQYHQQMQMVVSSFESVAGLSSATPYISMALKSVSRQFRCLKNAITDQLKHIREMLEMLGEDLSAPSSGTGSKLDNNAARLRYMDQSLQKNKSSGGNMAFLEPQQHVWRPQRGLPERSVAILRAWLFEHFLHPYPTDTDKHMLATQTGLSRNQVSNWFINARVRVWKPMVEEIHTLETKGLTGTNHNLSKGTSATKGPSQPRVDQSLNKFGAHTIPEKQLDCLEMGSYAGARHEEGLNAEQWNQEKRSKLECEITSNMDGTLMGFMPYRRGGIEVGGLGSVSLTLGLRHGVDGAQQQQHKLQQEDQLRHHFGGQMIHDFVG